MLISKNPRSLFRTERKDDSGTVRKAFLKKGQTGMTFLRRPASVDAGRGPVGKGSCNKSTHLMVRQI